MTDAPGVRPLEPKTIAPPAARYVHGVLVPAGADLVFSSGVVPTAADGSVPAGLALQAETVWANVGAILAEAGMGYRDIVSVTTYVVVGEDLGMVMGARDRALGDHRAASTLLTVPALARPEWKLEISVVAGRIPSAR